MGEFIDIPSPGWPLSLGDPSGPGVVLVHDRYGRLPYLESLAGALAKAGFHVVIPDLFAGLATVDDASAAELESGLDVGFAIATIEDAIMLAERPDGVSTGQRVAAVGFALGGYLALRAAQAGHLDAVVSYCAALGAEDPGIVPCPVLLHEADRADAIRQGSMEEFLGRLMQAGTPVTAHRYEDTSETFSNTSLEGRYERVAAALAFARTAQFLRRYLVD